MTPDEYEQLIAEIVDGFEKLYRLENCTLNSGNTNKVIGASGYGHQIDVSIHTPTELYLLEAKYWKYPVGVQEILVLVSRLADISKSSNLKTRASIVSTQKITSGALLLAAHFGVQVDLARIFHSKR